MKTIFLAPMLLSSCVKSPSNIMVVIQDFILASYFMGGFYNILKEHTFLYLPVTNGDIFNVAPAFWRFTYYHTPTNALIMSFIILNQFKSLTLKQFHSTFFYFLFFTCFDISHVILREHSCS
jgi:hypothetical protein